jgi:Domain of unknown function (DUF4263)
MKKENEKIPSFLKENLQSSIFGKIRLKLWKLISKKDGSFPSEKQIREFVRSQLRLNNEVGRLYLHLLNQSSPFSINYLNLKKVKNVQGLLTDLEVNPNNEAYLVEINDPPSQFRGSIGAYISCEDLLPEAYVYVIRFFDENFPDFFFTQIEIRASKKYPDPIFSEFVKTDWQTFDFANYEKSFFVDLSLKLLAQNFSKHNLEHLSIEQAINLDPNTDNKYKPPSDNYLLSLIKLTIKGQLTASKAELEIKRIRPQSIEFCLDFPKKTIEKIAEQIKKGEQFPLLIYWNKEYFIMSDDYPAYLAYRLLDIEVVPVVILGKYPKEIVEGQIIVGGKELLPLVGVEVRPKHSSLSPELQDWMIEKKLKRKSRSEVTSNLYFLFMGLNELISNPHTKERKIHDFIINNPTCFDVYGSRIKSELWLGKKYRVDLAIQYKLDEKKIQLVELERANQEIFTEKGRLRAYATHAIQQVEDWLQWWHENPNDRPKDFDSSILPEGLVVLGKSKNLSDEDKKRLTHLNSTRKVKLITYDDLLDRIEALIENLEAMEEES